MLKNKKILIVEDEQIIAENLRFILNEYKYTSVSVAMDAVEAQNLFEKTPFDLVLMDINLGDDSPIDGVDLIQLLSKKYSFVFIYITANADEKTIEKVKSTNPMGYLVKPFINESIYASVEIALNHLIKQTYFSFVDKGIHRQILLSEITYVKADGSYINIYTLKGKTYFLRISLASLFESYATIFIRIHKSILINKNHIIGYTSQAIKLKTSPHITLPLGRFYKKEFLEKIKGLSF